MNAVEKVAALAPTLVADALVVHAAFMTWAKARAAYAARVGSCGAEFSAMQALERLVDAAVLVAAANEAAKAVRNDDLLADPALCEAVANFALTGYPTRLRELSNEGRARLFAAGVIEIRGDVNGDWVALTDTGRAMFAGVIAAAEGTP